MPLYSQPIVGSSIWSGDVFQPGTILEGIQCIKQRVYIAINTPLGSDPLRPLFGSNIYQYTDRPLLLAAANIKREIIDAITLWVPEVTLNNVSFVLDSASGIGGPFNRATFTVNMTWGTTTLDPFVFSLGRGVFIFAGIQGENIVDADIPYCRAGHGYTLTLSFPGSSIADLTFPASGPPFPNIPAGVAYIEGYIGSFGTFGIGEDTLVFYPNEALYAIVPAVKLEIDVV